MSEVAVLVRFVHLAAAILLAGVFSFTLLIAEPAFANTDPPLAKLVNSFRRSQSRILRGTVVLLFATLFLGLWLQATNVAGSSMPALGVLFPLVTETQFGRVWALRLALLIVIAFLLKRGVAENPPANYPPLNLALGVTFLAASAFAGHAAAGDGGAFWLQAGADALHLIASGLWLGGLLPLFYLLFGCHRDKGLTSLAIAREAARRFSKLALASVIVLICTGLFNGWNLVGSFAPLLGTAYGQFLLLKLGLLLPLLAIAAVNLWQLRPAIAASSEPSGELRKLMRNVSVEMALGLAILLIVGYMGVTPPARHVQPDWPLSFRWDWAVIEKSAKLFAEVQRGGVWCAIGVIALAAAIVRRKRRLIATALGVAALSYGVNIVHQALMIDAYPDTYKRPAVAYQAIAIANGAALYRDSGCGACHGPSGQGDGPVAAELNPPPPNLTGRHANAHTAGDLFWWLSHGVKPTSAMPGFSQSLSDEERWDLINYLRALASGERSKNLAPVIDDQPALVAPDFNYATVAGEAKTLKDHRGSKIVLLVLLDPQKHGARLQQLAAAANSLQAASVELIVVPQVLETSATDNQLARFLVSEGSQEVAASYRLLARSFSNEGEAVANIPVEFLIDKQGYLRARWLPDENEGWRNLSALQQQIDQLAKEKPRAPAPDDHVH